MGITNDPTTRLVRANKHREYFNNMVSLTTIAMATASVRPEFGFDDCTGCIDAPCIIPVGSLKSGAYGGFVDYVIRSGEESKA